MRGVVTEGARAALIVVLILAAASKFHDYKAFQRALSASPLTRDGAGVWLWFVPALEVGLAGLLATAGSADILSLGFAATAGLFSAFSVWLVSVLRTGVATRCACFGVSHAVISWRTLSRNLGFITTAAGGAVLARDVSSMVVPPEPAFFAVPTLFVATLLALGYGRARPALTLTVNELEGEQ